MRESIGDLTSRLGKDNGLILWDFRFLFIVAFRGWYWSYLPLLLLQRTKQKLTILRWLYAILSIELLSGVVLAHVDMKALVQNAHLLFASILLGILFMLIFRIRQRNTALKA